MAIIVEEEKSKSEVSGGLSIVVVLGIAGAAVYYLFFASPEPAVVTPPPGYDSITPITAITFDPTSVATSPSFQSLKQYIPEPTSSGPTPIGRTNPLLAP